MHERFQQGPKFITCKFCEEPHLDLGLKDLCPFEASICWLFLRKRFAFWITIVKPFAKKVDKVAVVGRSNKQEVTSM